jgi:hypothetical protein
LGKLFELGAEGAVAEEVEVGVGVSLCHAGEGAEEGGLIFDRDKGGCVEEVRLVG